MDAIATLQTLLLTDEAAALALAPIVEPDRFTAAALALCVQHHIPLEPAQLDPLFGTDPRNLSRFASAPLTLGDAPPRHWLPTGVIGSGDAPHVEWLHFAAETLDRPFYQDSIQRAQVLPFNRLMRCATPLSALDAFADAPAPDGLIFHMSRCGSTLVAQMLTAMRGHIVVSEPPPLDTIIQLAGRGTVPPEAVRHMIAALTRDRSGTTRHRFVKLDSWHTLALPLLRSLYPDTPWVFLYRDPVEVLVSQARQPGLHAVPGMIPLAAFGITPNASVDHNDYAAWLLDLICKAALDAMGQGGGLLVNYRQLPDAVEDLILPHFGIAIDATQKAAMAAAAGKNSKAPDATFVADAAAKQQDADPAIRATADRHLTTSFAALEAMRLSMP